MKPTISIFGGFQNGKSTLINCILRQNIAEVGGQGLSVTKCNTRYTYSEETGVYIRKANGDDFIFEKTTNLTLLNCDDEVIVKIPSPILIPFDIVDTPGFNANEEDSMAAEYMLSHSDFAILLVHNKGMSSIEKNIAITLTKRGIPFIILINCYNDIFENWSPTSKGNIEILDAIKGELKSLKIRPFSVCGEPEIFVVNLIWYWLSIPHNKLLSDNKSIIRCSKLLHEFWDDFSDEEFSYDFVRELSGFNDFLSFFYSTGFLSFIKIASVLNEEKYFFESAFSKYSKEVKEVRKSYINKQIQSVKTTHIGYVERLQQEIKKYKAKLNSMSNSPNTGGFLAMIASSLFNGLAERSYIGEIAKREEKISNSARQSELLIDLHKKMLE